MSTKAPWTVSSVKPPLIRGNDAMKTVVAHVQWPSDAPLIAAAPELLEACKSMLAYIEMELAHEDVMTVKEIVERLKQSVPMFETVETSHHLGCPETTRKVDLKFVRQAIKKATSI